MAAVGDDWGRGGAPPGAAGGRSVKHNPRPGWVRVGGYMLRFAAVCVLKGLAGALDELADHL
jgi:hypothetical protein